jgi:hypothetical protein
MDGHPLPGTHSDNAVQPRRTNIDGTVMSSFLYVLILIFMAGVVVVLIRGLVNMMRGGSGNLSNKLMQMRIVLQFIAVVLIVAFLWITGGGR